QQVRVRVVVVVGIWDPTEESTGEIDEVDREVVALDARERGVIERERDVDDVVEIPEDERAVGCDHGARWDASPQHGQLVVPDLAQLRRLERVLVQVHRDAPRDNPGDAYDRDCTDRYPGGGPDEVPTAPRDIDPARQPVEEQLGIQEREQPEDGKEPV